MAKKQPGYPRLPFGLYRKQQFVKWMKSVGYDTTDPMKIEEAWKLSKKWW
jgi:hypothetical protein